MGQFQEKMNGVGDFEAMRAAQVEGMLALECLALPRNEILRQMEELFRGIDFRALEDLIEKVERMDST